MFGQARPGMQVLAQPGMTSVPGQPLHAQLSAPYGKPVRSTDFPRSNRNYSPSGQRLPQYMTQGRQSQLTYGQPARSTDFPRSSGQAFGAYGRPDANTGQQAPQKRAWGDFVPANNAATPQRTEAANRTINQWMSDYGVDQFEAMRRYGESEQRRQAQARDDWRKQYQTNDEILRDRKSAEYAERERRDKAAMEQAFASDPRNQQLDQQRQQYERSYGVGRQYGMAQPRMPSFGTPYGSRYPA